MSKSMPKRKRWVISGEYKFITTLTVILLVLTAIPYVFGYVSTPPEQRFMGLVFNVPDHSQYFSWYRELQYGFFAKNKLTPEPNEPVFFNLLWWTLGQIGLWTKLDVTLVFQIFRLFAGALFIWAVYQFCSLFLDQAWDRRIACLIITCGSGLGWILIVLKYTLTNGELLFPLDVHRAGTNSFLTIMAFPHFAMANSLIIITLILVLRGYEKKKLSYSFAAALVALVLGWQHAYDLITIYAVMLTFAMLEAIKAKRISWHLIWSGLIVGLFSSTAAIYSVYITNVYPIWKAVLAQFSNAGVFTADPFHMLILVGLSLVVAVFTFDGFVPLQQRSHREIFLKVWFLVSFFIGYLPTSFQVHLTNCWQVPVGVLATMGLFSRIIPYLGSQITRWNPYRFRRISSIVFVLAVLPTSVYLLVWRVFDLNRHDYPFYLHRDDIAALNWLQENSSPDDIVLCSITVGQYVPAISGNTAFLAHWAQTVDFYDKVERVARFFDASAPDEERTETLRAFGVDYVLHGLAERNLGDYDPMTAPWLSLVFSTPYVDVYRVALDSRGSP